MLDLNLIKSRLTCEDYLQSQGVLLRNHRCVSPLRAGAKNPSSFMVDSDHWFDFSAGQGGDIIDLVAQMECGGDIGLAINTLAERLNLSHPGGFSVSQWRDDIQRLCNRTAAYHAALTDDDLKYLHDRGITDDTINELMIGRVTDTHLKGRLFLPYLKNGHPVYYATRSMPGGAHADAKYMKASKTECESYENVPWGIPTLSRSKSLLVISEGYFDAVSWYQDGYAVLSPITGRFSKEQWPFVISACKSFDKVLIIFDNDAVSHAGEGFTKTTANTLLKYHIPFVIAHTPTGIKDVNDYYAAGGDLKTLVDTAEDGLTFLAKQYNNATDLKHFILSINRYTDPTRISSTLSAVADRFTPMEIKSIAKAAEAAPPESKIADEIIDAHNLIYIDNVGFYEWDGRVWSRQPDAMIRLYADQTYGKMFATASRVNNVMNLCKARSLRNIAFDRKPLISFANGTLDIETDIMHPHNPADFCSIIMDYNYDPAATCPRWESFIEDVTDNEPHRMELLQFIAGYVLFPTCQYQKVFILTGSGGNGKSVYLEILQRLFGSANVTHVEPTGLPQDFQRIRLKDSLLNIGADINSDFGKGEIREWILKIADGTTVQACYKGLNYIDFVPRCKLVYACNALPTAEIINGLNRRMQFVDFIMRYTDTPDPSDPHQRPRNVNIVSELTEELSGIFNWVLRGYHSLKNINSFTDAPEQEKLMSQFEEQSNPIMVFCEDMDYNAGEYSRDDIYEDYQNWCHESGHMPFARERFMPKFRDAMGKRIEREYMRRIDGTRLRFFLITSSETEQNDDFEQKISSSVQEWVECHTHGTT